MEGRKRWVLVTIGEGAGAKRGTWYIELVVAPRARELFFTAAWNKTTATKKGTTHIITKIIPVQYYEKAPGENSQLAVKRRKKGTTDDSETEQTKATSIIECFK